MRLPAIFRRKEAKESAVGGMLWPMTYGRAAWQKRDSSLLARDAYERNVVASTCIYMVAQAVGTLQWDLFRKGAGKIEEVDEHPALDLIANPNPMQDGEDYLRALLTHYQITGNAYPEQVTGLGSLPVELYALRPDRVRVVPGQDGFPMAYDYSVGGQTRRIPIKLESGLRPILHIREPNPLDDNYGMSRVDPAGFSIDVHTDHSRLSKGLLQNSARPSGAFVTGPDDNLTTDQRASLLAQLADMFQGAKNAGKPMVLGAGLDWKPLGLNMKDLEFNESKANAAREIAFSMGVPSLLLGIPGDNTFANYAEAHLAFYRTTVLPLARRMCRAHSRWLLPAYPDSRGLYFDIDEDEIPALATERAAKFAAIQNADFLTVDEKREAVGYEALGKEKGGEQILVSSTMIPLDQAGEMPQGGAAPGPEDLIDEPTPKPKPAGKAEENFAPVFNLTMPSPRITVQTGDVIQGGPKEVIVKEFDHKGRALRSIIRPIEGGSEPATVTTVHPSEDEGED